MLKSVSIPAVHPQLKTLTDNFDKQISLLTGNMGSKLIFIDFFYFFFLTKQNICLIPVDWQKKVPSQKPELSFLKVHGHNTPKNTKLKK